MKARRHFLCGVASLAFAFLLLGVGPASAEDNFQNLEWDFTKVDMANLFDAALLPAEESLDVPGADDIGWQDSDLTSFLDPDCSLYRTDEPGTKSIMSGETASDYVMVSIPVEAHQWLLAQLDADLGEYNPLFWRIFRYNPDSEAYDECNDIQAIRPGLGYWIISGSKFTLSLDGWCTTEAYTYPMALEPGWNQIGNPFEEPVAWADVEVYDSLGSDLVYTNVLSRDNTITGRTLWAYTADRGYVSYRRLRPFGGYWVKNHTDHEVLLLIPSPLADKPSALSAKDSSDQPDEEQPPPPPGGFGDLSPLGGGGCFVSTGMPR